MFFVSTGDLQEIHRGRPLSSTAWIHVRWLELEGAETPLEVFDDFEGAVVLTPGDKLNKYVVYGML